jgi:hypothetical protein
MLRNLSHLNILCDSLHKIHCVGVTTLQYEDLLTLVLADCCALGLRVAVLDDCVSWMSSIALQRDSRIVINSEGVGTSVRTAVSCSHCWCVLLSNDACIKWFNIKSWNVTFNDSAFSAHMWLDTWFIRCLNAEASPFLTCGIWHKYFACIIAISPLLLYRCITNCQARRKFSFVTCKFAIKFFALLFNDAIM